MSSAACDRSGGGATSCGKGADGKSREREISSGCAGPSCARNGLAVRSARQAAKRRLLCDRNRADPGHSIRGFWSIGKPFTGLGRGLVAAVSALNVWENAPLSRSAILALALETLNTQNYLGLDVARAAAALVIRTESTLSPAATQRATAVPRFPLRWTYTPACRQIAASHIRTACRASL